MIKQLQEKHNRFHQKFLVAWSAATLVFMIMIGFAVWDRQRSATLHDFNLAVGNIAFKMEEIVEGVLESLDTIPIYTNEARSCQETLPKLQDLIFNSPYMSGIIISSPDKKILCETYHKGASTPPTLTSTMSPILFGPLQINGAQTDIYFLQKQFAQYHIGVYLLKKMFDAALDKSERFAFTGLYDRIHQQMIFKKGKSFPDGELLAKTNLNERIVTMDGSSHCEAVLPLSNLDNITLVIRQNPTAFIQKLAIELLIGLLVTMLASWWAYQYVSRMISRHFSIEYALKTALEKRQFYPMYQPVWDSGHARFCGAEVLIRWKTHFNEIVSPDKFIDYAEQFGLIVPMTLQLMERVFKECAAIFQSNSSFYLSFNLSPAHFKDATFFRAFYRLCADSHIPANQIMLELTERELFDETDTNSITIMQELRAKGFSLAIDDFGTGQSNIKYLQHFPFNYLKIDKTFIKTIGTGAIIESLNKGIINIAQSLHLKIIAEGVETPGQVDYLSKNNVNFMQGWLYAHAMPYEQFAKLAGIRT